MKRWIDLLIKLSQLYFNHFSINDAKPKRKKIRKYLDFVSNSQDAVRSINQSLKNKTKQKKERKSTHILLWKFLKHFCGFFRQVFFVSMFSFCFVFFSITLWQMRSMIKMRVSRGQEHHEINISLAGCDRQLIGQLLGASSEFHPLQKQQQKSVSIRSPCLFRSNTIFLNHHEYVPLRILKLQ